LIFGGFLAWTGTGLLVLRAGAGLLQGVYELVTGQFDLRSVGIWEPWFYLGAALFGVNLWQYRRRVREAVRNDVRARPTP